MTIPFKAAWRGEADCRNCSLRTSALFSGLEEKDFEHIHRPIEEFNLTPHQALYRAGDPGDAVYTIRNGLMKLVQYLPDGSQRIVRLLHSADVAGLEALLGQSYQHDAVVLQAASVCRLPIEVVKRLDRDSPKLHHELLLRWQRALTEADAWLTLLSTGTARQRVARLLLRLLEKSDNPGICELFSREDVGAILGITTETASRMVAEFKRKGLLEEISPSRYRCNRPELEAIGSD